MIPGPDLHYLVPLLIANMLRGDLDCLPLGVLDLSIRNDFDGAVGFTSIKVADVKWLKNSGF